MMTPDAPLPAGTLSRPLGNLEIFFKKLADLGAPLQHEHWAVHLALRLDVEVADPEAHLRKAWQIVAHQHPAIRSTVSPARKDDDAKPSNDLYVVTPFDAESWMKETFRVERDHEDANALFATLRPSAFTMCYWLPRSSELVIRSSHWRLDGIGVLGISSIFLSAFAEVLQHGPDHAFPFSGGLRGLLATPTPLPQNVELLATKKTKTDPQILDVGADALMAEFFKGVPSIGLPTTPHSEQALPGSSARAEVILNARQTTQVINSRRDHGFSFTGAVHAAIVRVTAAFPQHPLSKAYAAFFPVDLRKSITAVTSLPHQELLFGLYFSGLPICLENAAAKGFQELAREMTTVYNRDLEDFWKTPSGESVSMLQLAEPYLTRTTALFTAPVPQDFPPTQTPDLSGLGKVGQHLQSEYQASPEAPKIKVTSMWLATEMLNRSVQFHVWSWKENLHVGASFNQSFYEKPFVEDVLKKVVRELLGGLGIDE
ncbi:hypothetical protein HYALB_00011024 [Hymenoscyphus albidus]|uniref:Uncharacterized protein n=1 Tax=Hymenoscyphus albidus TaxID=595503 RepID=A0A9N9Q6L4_9HELO|nr:hypothetical protein HYALB_00011024 [Hymenoscyphus albidus]